MQNVSNKWLSDMTREQKLLSIVAIQPLKSGLKPVFLGQMQWSNVRLTQEKNIARSNTFYSVDHLVSVAFSLHSHSMCLLF